MKSLLKIALAFVLGIVSGRSVALAEEAPTPNDSKTQEMTDLQKKLAGKGALNDPKESVASVRCH